MKSNIYDYVISELLFYLNNNNSYSSPYLEVNSNLLFNDQAPFNFNGNVVFTSEVKNIPLGYTVKANTHIITYPIVVSPDTNSSSILIGSSVPVIFSSIGDTFTINVTITLEKPSSPDIVLTKTFTINAVGAIFFGTKPTNNSFSNTSLSSTAYVEANQKVLLPNVVNEYVYFSFPTGSNLPLFIRDRNGLVIDINNFTLTTFGGYDFLVLNWNTSLPDFSTWELVYNL